MRSLACLLLVFPIAAADTVHLKDGSTIHGRVLTEGPTVVVNTYNSTQRGMTRGVCRMPSAKIARIERTLPRPHEEFRRRIRIVDSAETCLELAK
ncbi:MAG: hypothetical protein ACYTDU_09425, partial [Planctomycetota bacterium]